MQESQASVFGPRVSAILPVIAADGAKADLLLVTPLHAPAGLLYWLPAMGIAAKHYLPLAEALAARGIAVTLHEWRGIGSSDQRAGRNNDWAYRELLQADLPAGIAAARERFVGLPCWLGGHSLGGQLASLYASLYPHEHAGIALVASGSPYWRRFRQAYLIGLSYVLAPWLARLMGYLPGRRIGFGGNEARSVIADWARSGRTGRYAAAGVSVDFEARLSELDLPLLALRLRDDWLGPEASLAWLLGKMPRVHAEREVLTPQDLDGTPADHFAWMKSSEAVAARIARWMAATTKTNARSAATS
ncbi:Predicted alpha/beta hydrolase [Dyella sp. OK004]|uniref:alpha/beta hydrolase family protein n=1 Tax=Dyella sp. OK004 TaxID=1855292 RepID=UPI0008ECA6F2|nr:alpha/beta fold hydrolase [Dyella sp. OK004]SFS01797.1 Predicted alpha/beta hydrolase [Dyella sp. OK004]